MTDLLPIPTTLVPLEKDILQELLQDRRSPNTRRTYAKSLRDFFVTMTQGEPSPERIAWFLCLNRFEAIALVLRYRAGLVEKGLKPATINVRLSAVKSLVNYARKIGKCDYTLDDVEGLRAETYRDTSGVSPDGFKQITAAVNGDSLKGKRDLAILRLLWDNALRRAEVCTLNIEDYQPGEGKLWIKGKGKLTKEPISLSGKAIGLIDDWLGALGERGNRESFGKLRNTGMGFRERQPNGSSPSSIPHFLPTTPLFCTVDRATFGHRLSGNAIYNIVRNTAESAGITKVMSPHRIRHSAITAALDATGGDARKVQKLSRHKNLNTLMIYDDNRRQHQAEVTGILADLV
jgi:integrase/recombinase XerC